MAETSRKRSIHLDAVGGIAGDMFVAAMLDAFPELVQRVLMDVAALVPAKVGEARLERGDSGGISALRFGLEPHAARADHAQSAHKQAAHHHHDHHHDHDRHHHHHHDDDGNVADTGHGHAHHHHIGDHGSAYRDLVERLKDTPLSDGTTDRASAILKTLAEAEARVHGVDVEAVHFHELADWDSLMDVAAAGSIVAALGDVDWSVSSLPRGSGLVRTQHGLLPVPAPATTLMLEGFDLRDDGIGGERVTPTGAAIVRTFARSGASASGRLVASGIGAGTRSLPGMPNILRVLVFESVETVKDNDTVAVIEFEVDDMTGEEIGVAADALRAVSGVLDLSLGTRAGKKSRPVNDFRLLVKPEAVPEATRQCLLQTSTIGLRQRLERRVVLEREARSVEGGMVKTVQRPDGTRSTKAESDGLADAASLMERRSLARRREET